MTHAYMDDPNSPFYGADAATMGNLYRDMLGLVLSKSGPQRITEDDIHAYRASGLQPYLQGEGSGYFDLSLQHPEDV